MDKAMKGIYVCISIPGSATTQSMVDIECCLGTCIWKKVIRVSITSVLHRQTHQKTRTYVNVY